jgi:hypothetical protein
MQMNERVSQRRCEVAGGWLKRPHGNQETKRVVVCTRKGSHSSDRQREHPIGRGLVAALAEWQESAAAGRAGNGSGGWVDVSGEPGRQAGRLAGWLAGWLAGRQPGQARQVRLGRSGQTRPPRNESVGDRCRGGLWIIATTAIISGDWPSFSGTAEYRRTVRIWYTPPYVTVPTGPAVSVAETATRSVCVCVCALKY